MLLLLLCDRLSGEGCHPAPPLLPRLPGLAGHRSTRGLSMPFLRRCRFPAGNGSCPAAAAAPSRCTPVPVAQPCRDVCQPLGRTRPPPLQCSRGCRVSAAIQTSSTATASLGPLGAPGGACGLVSALPSSSAAPPSHAPAFRCLDVWISQMCLCVEQGTFCWLTAVWLVVTLRGESRMSPRATWLLMSLSYWCPHRFSSI